MYIDYILSFLKNIECHLNIYVKVFTLYIPHLNILVNDSKQVIKDKDHILNVVLKQVNLNRYFILNYSKSSLVCSALLVSSALSSFSSAGSSTDSETCFSWFKGICSCVTFASSSISSSSGS